MLVRPPSSDFNLFIFFAIFRRLEPIFSDFRTIYNIYARIKWFLRLFRRRRHARQRKYSAAAVPEEIGIVAFYRP